MASACTAVSLIFSIRAALASGRFFEPRMILMTRSSLPRAILRPSMMCARFSALSSSKRERRRMISLRWPRK